MVEDGLDFFQITKSFPILNIYSSAVDQCIKFVWIANLMPSCSVSYCYEILQKNGIFLKFYCQFQNPRLGVCLEMCLAMCLKFPKFEAGCAYKLIAYKKKRVRLYVQLRNDQ